MDVASASAMASAVPSRGQRGYRIPPGKNSGTLIEDTYIRRGGPPRPPRLMRRIRLRRRRDAVAINGNSG